MRVAQVNRIVEGSSRLHRVRFDAPPDQPAIPIGVNWSTVEVVGLWQWVSPRQIAPTLVQSAPAFVTLQWPTHIANISHLYGGSGNHDLGGFGVLHMEGPQDLIEVRGSATPSEPHTVAYFENDYAFLDRVFEWYYDQSSHSVCIVLCQHPDLTNLKITIPVLEQLLVVDRASHLSFEGLDFAYAHMPLPRQADGVTPGYATFQSGNQWLNGSWGWSNHSTLLKPAVVLAGAESCSLIGCRIAHVSGTGLAVHTWRGAPGYYIESHDNYIERCEVFDTGGHGVWIGDELADIDDWTSIGASPTKSEPSANNRMIHSWVHDYGTMYRDAVGVYIAHTIGTEVSDCRISNGGWSGMSIGGFQSHTWNQQTQPSSCAPHNGQRPYSNLGLDIVRNEVHTVCTHLADGEASTCSDRRRMLRATSLRFWIRTLSTASGSTRFSRTMLNCAGCTGTLAPMAGW